MPASDLLQVEIAPSPDHVLVRLIGEARLDVEAAGIKLDRGVIVHHPKVVIVDCSQLTIISSIGMSLLVNLRRAINRAGGIVILAGLLPMVQGALHHASLLPLFQLFPDLPSALASLGGASPVPPAS